MGALKEVLYDHIGREYERLNEYLKEVAVLENQIKRSKGEEKNSLIKKLSEVKSNKETHPYIIKLKAFHKKEKEYLQKRDAEAEEYIKGFGNVSDLAIRKNLFKAEKDEVFYDEYKDFDYEAKLNYEVAKLKTYHLPKIIAFRNETESKIKVEIEKGKNITGEKEHLGRKEFNEFKNNAKLEYQKSLEELKEKKSQGLISDKALSNGKIQLKKELNSKLDVRRYEVPKIGNVENIKSLKYDLKERTKLMYNIMNKDIADVRRKTPVETEQRTPFRAFTSLVIPGFGQILNKEYLKGILFLIGSLFIYFLAVPYSLGKNNYQGQGLKGLFTLAKGMPRIHKSQIYMIEGILSMAFLAIALTLIIVSFLDAYKTEKAKIRGVRERNTFEIKNSMEEDGFPYFVSLPALLFILFIVIVPLMTTVLLSFANMDPNNQSKFTWAGLSNYAAVAEGRGMAGKAFWNILSWTLIWTIFATTLAILVGFGLALLANNPRIKGKGFFRMVYLLPWAVPAFVTIMFFSLLMAPNGFISNIVNDVSSYFGGNPDIRIKSDTSATRIALIFLQTWLGSAYVFLLSTGVLQAIPEELYEAAQIDGATTWQRIVKITVPLVTFQTAPLLVGQYTFNFNNFNIIYLFNKGGPFDTSKYGNLAGSSDLLISYIYKLTMESKYQSLAAAITLIISMALMFFAFLGFRNSKAFKEEKL